MKKSTILPKLLVNHDYITLKLPTGNFTTSRSGAKVTGQLVNMGNAFNVLDNYIQTQAKTRTMFAAFNDLLNPKLLDKLVPNWNNPIIAENLVEGDFVKFTSTSFIKKYPNSYVVRYTKGKYTYILVPNKKGELESIGFYSTELKKVH